MKKLKKKKSSKKKSGLLVVGISFLSIGIIFGGYFFKMKSYFGLTAVEMYQNIANPYLRNVRITEGMRKEEVIERFGKTLGWSETEKRKLLAIHSEATKGATEGYFFPGNYVVPLRAKAPDVSKKIITAFNEEVVESNEKLKTNVINMDTAIKIASIIQREAGSKSDMKIISGVIWNRLFEGMSLDMDATLQYAKGSKTKWWPKVVPADKYIESPFNTYKNKGLPPSAISNPGEAAIEAALNPGKTDAFFYLHDDNGKIHTARTYQEHLDNIERVY
ncbi:MAG: endolytic transglycosylase MltG [Patescibacteria group bacterium]